MARQVDIVLVEDNPDDADLARNALRDVLNPIYVVRDGEEALEFLWGTGRYAGAVEVGNPKLVLLDLRLPKVDGIEVLRRMRSDERLRDVPVIVMTSSSSARERDMASCQGLGVIDYMIKPVDFSQLRMTVRTLGMGWLMLDRSAADVLDRVAP